MDSKSDNKPLRTNKWRIIRWLTIGLASFVTLIALFYAEEDWRGKRAWEDCKRQMEAKGINYDWSALVPPPVPDDMNFYKAPGIAESDWVGRGAHDLSKRFEDAVSLAGRDSNSVLMAKLNVVTSADIGHSDANETKLLLGNTNTMAEARKLIDNVVGPTLSAARGFTLIARPLDQIRPVSLELVATSGHMPTTNDLAELFPKFIGSPDSRADESSVLIETTEGNAFHLTLSPPPETAEDYLKRTAPLEPEFEMIRTALKRPYARMDGDYSTPPTVPIPNFVMMRVLAQTLATRAKCDLLLDHPDEALRDLMLVHDICRPLETKPTGKPMTLLAAMINVAIMGLYADTVADGFRLHAWREPQLMALQQQLAQTDVLPLVCDAFDSERVSSPATFEKCSPATVFDMEEQIKGAKPTWWAMMRDPLFRFWALAPRGWIYQNMVSVTKLTEGRQTGDAATGLVSPERARRSMESSSKWSPYSYLSAITTPNFTRAWQTTARTESLVHEAFVACALERYRQAHGDYPQTLDALSPSLAEKMPHDVIGGGPLRYRRNADGTFLLYSIGWNEKDDGGQMTMADGYGNQSLDSGDWVWEAGLEN